MKTTLSFMMLALPLGLSCSPERSETPGAPHHSLVSAPSGALGELVEDRSVYDQDDLSLVPVIRLTVSDTRRLEDVNRNQPGAEVEVLLQEGTFGEGRTRPNGMLSLRGRSARSARQKSYKIVMFDRVPLWRGQKRVHLLKNANDLTRARSYLAFEYFKRIRHVTSMRHQLVRVVLNREDLGLFEWFEHPGRRFLESHGLDANGALYNVQLFTFRPYSDNLFECADDSDECLEIEENHDPQKVRRMLQAVNDPARSIDEIIDTHFQRDNYETWLALQILFSSYSSFSHNYYLYSPRASERWYFLPWDYNGAFMAYEQPRRRDIARSRTMVAPGYFSQATLHERYLRVPANVEALRRRIAALRAGPVNDEETGRILAAIHDRVRSHVERDPDLRYLPVSDRRLPVAEQMREWEAEWTRLLDQVSRAQRLFEETVEWPMGVWLGDPSRRSSGLVRFRWDAAYDPQGDGISYDFRLARSPLFEPPSIVVERGGLRSNTLELPGIAAGTYFYTVISRDDADPDEHWQIPFSRTRTVNHNVTHWGVKKFSLR